MNKLSRGFTLFEILIVVVIIGLLAVGLIAAIDPIESIRKTGDTNLQVNAKNLQNAFALYYAREGTMPWNAAVPCDGNTGGSDIPDGTSTSTAMSSSTVVNPCVAVLQTTGDLKASFANSMKANGKSLYLKGSSAAGFESTIYVCFQPQSKSFKKTQNNSATLAPVDGAPVIETDPTAANYWCTF